MSQVKQNKVFLGLRIVQGLIFTVFGLNGFLNFLPQPAGMPEAAMNFAGAMAATGYMFPLIKGTEVLMGLLLLSGYSVPFALVVLSPIVINIFLFHFVLTPGDFALQLVIVLIHAALGYGYKESFKSLFGKTNPTK